MRAPDYERDGVRLYCGDAAEMLRGLPTGSIDAIVTDPPYSINTKSDGDGKLNPWGDLCNAALFYREWIGECRRVLRPDGCLWSFLSWRSLATFQKAACDLRWPIESLLVWDKEWIGPGGHCGLRPSYELVALWAMPEFAIPDRGLTDIQRFKWCGTKPTGHPAEKPLALIDWIIRASGKTATAIVCDPFSGSGTTAIAARKLGLSFVGSEIDESWAAASVRRIDAELAQGKLFGTASTHA